MPHSRFARFSLVWLLAGAALTACSDSTGPGDGSFRVELVEAPGAGLGWGPNWDGPLIACLIPVDARAAGKDQIVTWRGASLMFFQGPSRTIAVDTAFLSVADLVNFWGFGALRTGEEHRFTLDVRGFIPFEAVLDVMYAVAGVPKKASVRLTCGPRPPARYEPPVVATPTLSAPEELRPGDEIVVGVSAASTYGLMRTRVIVDGPFRREDSWLNYAKTAANHTISYVVPPDALPGIPITVTATTFDAAGQERSNVMQTTKRVVDIAPPVLESAVPAGGVAGWIAPADFLGFRLVATDDLGIARVIIDVDADRDFSIDVPYASEFGLTVTAAWAGFRSVSVRVVDLVGKPSNTIAIPPGTFRYYPEVSRSITSLPIPAQQTEPIYDPRRERLYFTDPVGPSLGRIDLESMTRLPSVPLPLADGEGWSGDGDLTVSGDTLLLSLPDAAGLLLIDLAAPTPTVVRVPLRALPRSGGEPVPIVARDVKVGADGTVFLLASRRSAQGDQLLTVALATGIAEWIDLGALVNEADTDYAYLGRDPGRGRLILQRQGCPRALLVATRRVLSCGTGFSERFHTSRPHYSPSGRTVMVAGIAYDENLQVLPGFATIRDSWWNHAAFSLDESMLWVVEWEYLTRLRLSDGVRLDRMVLVGDASSILVSPRGNALFFVSEFRNAVTRVSLP